MTPEEMILNLFCLDKGIIQLNDISSVQKQFDALDPDERRRVSRKIRKLAKKFIQKSTLGFEEITQQKRSSAGLSEDAPRSRRLREKYNRIKVLYARRLLLKMISDEKNHR